ncbi:DUF2834 domain-containing protein [Cohaesibacter sp. CAU 1516]|uniref:DUF2834 domain-containing protein n=1 Tax=Cohaesibacter sp. CAU 1516 TaxID=2576038 RepID=UPI0010FF21EC|nr:DUF2834 domain-containing protein [Cohaesibacter sp. CAU 1516]TLP48881.1 DUF2834 domain-containing protein [Cohaesibacter sp. CAU 1516]
MTLARFYLLMCLVGTLWPWIHFADFFSSHGADFALFFAQMTPTAVAKGLTVDISLSILVFWVWSFVDARQLSVRNWWLVLPATLCVGFSLALPLYLFLRESKA